jgi:hypothetical protein
MSSVSTPGPQPPATEVEDQPYAGHSDRGRLGPLHGLRARALLVAIPLLIGISFLSVYADMVSKKVQFGVLQLAPPAVIGLFLLALLNRGLTRLLRREWLSRGDIVIIYAMLLVGVMVSTRGVIEKLIPPLAYLPYYATAENKLNETLTQHLPGFAMPFDPQSNLSPAPEWIRTYFEAVRAGEPIPYDVWVGPLLAWFGLIACVIWCFACLATILRRQWMDNEQLRFPLTTLPLAIINNEVEGQPFFSNRTMWLGFAFSAAVFTLNGLRANFPDWPQFTTFLSTQPFFSERPWSGMDYMPMYISLAAVGFLFFLPTDLLFSLWFFFLVTRFQDVAAVQMGAIPTGIGTHNARVWTGYQAAGAYLALIAAQLRIGWPYFKQVWRTAVATSTRNKPLDDSDELMSYRVAVFGLVAGFGGIILWLWIAGMNPIFAALQMGLYMFFIAVIMSRTVNEAGLLMTETSFLPQHLIHLFYPLHGVGPASLTMGGLLNVVFIRDLRGVLLSPLMDNQKMAGETRLRQRSLLLPLAIAVVVAFVVASFFFLKLSYSLGNLSLYDYPNANVRNIMGRTAEAVNGGTIAPGATEYGGLVVGVIVTSLLVYCRATFAWFPLHPLAYAIAPTWTMIVFWIPCIFAWIAKSLVLRFGGIDLFRRLAPFALGLILGEFSLAVLWAVISMLSPTILGFKFTTAPEFPWP